MAVVPGVVFLSFILDVRKLKFLQMLLPQQRFVVEFAEPSQVSLRFKCWREQQANEPRQLLVDGNLQLATALPTGPTS
jgi:hypothetical protein